MGKSRRVGRGGRLREEAGIWGARASVSPRQHAGTPLGEAGAVPRGSQTAPLKRGALEELAAGWGKAGKKSPLFLKGFAGPVRRVPARRGSPGLEKQPRWPGSQMFSPLGQPFYLNKPPVPAILPVCPTASPQTPPSTIWCTGPPNPNATHPAPAGCRTRSVRPHITPTAPHHPPAPPRAGLPGPGSVPRPPAPCPGAGPAPAGGVRSGWGPGGRRPAPPAAARSGGRAGWPAAAAAGRSTS